MTGGAGNAAGTGSDTGAGGEVSSGGAGNETGTGGDVSSGGVGAATGTGGGVGDGGSPSDGGTGGMMTSDCPGLPTEETVTRPNLVVSGPGAFWQQASFQAGTSANVTVDPYDLQQEWHGFGGTFNEAGWDALSVLSVEQRELAIRLLFSRSEGAHFSWGRIPIGASDYAMDRYTLNDTAGDYEMANFSIDRDRLRLIPYIKAAQSVNPRLKFWGSPWTPPPWMKTETEYNGTNLLPDSSNEGSAWYARMKDDAQTLQAHALYFSRWVEEYEAECIPIDHVQPQNEPGYETRYPSCGWDGGLLGTFVGDYLGPTFEARGLGTEIWFGTLSNENTYQGFINGLTGAAANYSVGVGLQWNTKDHTAQLASDGYLVMQTEHKCGNYPWKSTIATSAESADRESFLPGMAPNNHNYGVETWDLIQEWLVAGVNIYSAWNMVLDTEGQNLDAERPWPQNALLVVDRGSMTLTPTPAYYVFRHISYFVDPGAVRLGTSGGNALAFKNPDQSVVVIVHNAGQSAASTTVGIDGNLAQFEVPGRGWATYLQDGNTQ